MNLSEKDKSGTDILKVHEAHREAICHGEGPARVLAGPGSGKTFVIVQRLKYLLEELQIEPASILVITFTKAAAVEMQQRFYRLMGEPISPVHFGTFHAVFYYILKQSNSEFSKNILSESDKINLIRKLKVPFEKEFPSVSLPPDEELIKQIGKFKNVGEEYSRLNVVHGNFMEEPAFLWLYEAYNQLLHQEEKLDFDDMAKQCLLLLKKNPKVRAFWQQYFRYILIDEFQDINEPQYEVVKCLVGEQKNLFVVGDDDQAIYGFRGSNPGIMKRFVQDYPACKCILLNVNYRSREEIVKAAGKCIAENKDRVMKKFIAKERRKSEKESADDTQKQDVQKAKEDENVQINKNINKNIKKNKNKNDGQPVVIKAFAKKAEEQSHIVKRLQEWRASGGIFSNTAIICRTNFELEEVALLLERSQIPFQRREKKKSLFEHPIMRDFAAYLRLAEGEQSRSLMLQIINHPARFVGRTFFTKEAMGFAELKEACRCAPEKYFKVVKLEADCNKIARMSPFLAVNYIRKGIGYDAYLKELAGNSRAQLEAFMELADYFQNHAKDYGTSKEWLRAIEKHKEEYARSENILIWNAKSGNVQNGDAKGEKQGVHLLTMHGAKGLEFSLVIIPDVNEGIIPRGRTLSKETVEEERRMFYVAMTRAKDFLEMYYVNGEGERKRLPSRFLKTLLEKQP